jgi:hypothetical protein
MPKAAGMVRQAVKAYNTKELRKVHKHLRKYLNVNAVQRLTIPY